MKRWNVLVSVVEVVEAATAEDAIRVLCERLEREGFDPYVDDMRGTPDAFESESEVRP